MRVSSKIEINTKFKEKRFDTSKQFGRVDIDAVADGLSFSVTLRISALGAIHGTMAKHNNPRCLSAVDLKERIRLPEQYKISRLKQTAARSSRSHSSCGLANWWTLGYIQASVSKKTKCTFE